MVLTNMILWINLAIIFPVSRAEMILAFLEGYKYKYIYIGIFRYIIHTFQSQNRLGLKMCCIYLNRLSHKKTSLPSPGCSTCFVTKEHFGERIAAQSQPKKTTTSYSSNFIQCQPWSHQQPDLENM